MLLGRRSGACRSAGFPPSLAFGRRFEAVIDRIADQVHQRIGDLLDDALVELGLAARIVSSTSLSNDRARSRTARGNASNTVAIGSIVSSMTCCRSSSVIRCQARLVVAEVHEERAHAPVDRVERVGVVAELRRGSLVEPAPAALRGRGRAAGRALISTRRNSAWRSDAFRLWMTISGARCVRLSSFSIGHAQRLPRPGTGRRARPAVWSALAAAGEAAPANHRLRFRRP